MAGFQAILVPILFAEQDRLGLSPDSQEAVSQARDLAREHGAEMTFCHVFAGPAEEGASSDDELPRIRARLDELVKDCQDVGITARWTFLFGHPWEEICSLAGTEEFDLVVMGTRRRQGQGESLVGSTAGRVLHSRCAPLWIAKSRVHAERCVVVATDLSPRSTDVVRHAVSLARTHRAPLHLVHACETEKELVVCRARMEAQIAEALGEEGMPALRSHVQVGTPEGLVWSIARERQADVVVIGVREHTDLDLLLHRPTAEEVITELPCSMLALPVREN